MRRCCARKLRVVGLLALLYVCWPQPHADAYLDPATGNYVLQMIVAAVLGAAFTLRTFWTRMTASLKQLLSQKKDPPPANTGSR